MFRYKSSGDGFYLKKDSIHHNIYARHKLPNLGISSLPRRNTSAKFQRGLHCHVPFHTRLVKSFGRERYIRAGNLRYCEIIE
jgi:hypothetical protein